MSRMIYYNNRSQICEARVNLFISYYRCFISDYLQSIWKVIIEISVSLKIIYHYTGSSNKNASNFQDVVICVHMLCYQ